MIKNCIEPESGETKTIWGNQNRVTFSWEKAVRASIIIWLVRVGLVISVDREHGTGMDHIASAPASPL
jgi:hypothetical protein